MRDSYSKLSHTFQTLDQDHWHRILDDFQDASVFQTTAFYKVKSDAADLEHFLLLKEQEVLAAAQVRLIHAPLFGGSIAYVLWGPFFHRQKSEPDLAVLQQAIRSLRQEYVVNRGMSLRINPQFTVDEGPDYLSVFTNEGYMREVSRKPARTILIALDRPIDVIRKGLDQKWRNCLNRGEKNALQLIEGNNSAMFELFLQMYRQMLARKRLAEPGDIRAFMAMQNLLPTRHKMKVFVALERGEPSAGAICSAIGKRGVYLFGATADAGLRNKAAYLVQWRILNWLKESNCVEYDLHGVNAKSNPGVYSFKVGLCGKNGREVEFLGNFDACQGLRAKLLLQLVDMVREQRLRIKNMYEKYRGFTG